MRITDARYARDLRRLNLAMRLIRHEARTSTIRECTGLAGDRIRRLYYAYLRRPGRCSERHRGKSPHAALRVLGSPRLAAEAAVFVWASRQVGVAVPGADAPGQYLLLSVERAEALCEAFELYRECLPESQLSFEQALCVMRGLWAREEIACGRCVDCGAFVLRDQLSLCQPRCIVCAHARGMA